jgi:hypothetical protein
LRSNSAKRKPPELVRGFPVSIVSKTIQSQLDFFFDFLLEDDLVEAFEDLLECFFVFAFVVLAAASSAKATAGTVAAATNDSNAMAETRAFI